MSREVPFPLRRAARLVALGAKTGLQKVYIHTFICMYVCILPSRFMLYALCFMLYALCFMLYALCFMLYALCFTRHAQPLNRRPSGLTWRSGGPLTFPGAGPSGIRVAVSTPTRFPVIRATMSATRRQCAGVRRHALSRPAGSRHSRAGGPLNRPRRRGRGSAPRRRLAPAGGRPGGAVAIAASFPLISSCTSACLKR